MAERLSGGHGGIDGVLDELDAYPHAVTADLWSAGLYIDEIGASGSRTDWLLVVSTLKAAPNDSALNVEKHGDKALWTAEMELAALLIERIDALRWENAGSPAGNKPKRIVRPGVKDETQRYGQGESWTPASFDLWWEMKGEELDS